MSAAKAAAPAVAPAAAAAAGAGASAAAVIAASKPAAPEVTFNFAGRLALVTGSTVGIGYAIALAYARAGADVVVNGRDQKTVDAVVAKWTAEEKPTGKLYGIAADVGSAAGCKKLIAAVDAIGAVDFLVNNVSIFSAKTWTDIDDEEWERYHQINLMSCVRLSRHFLPKMLARNSGRVLIISSECGVRPITPMLAYAVSKGSQITLARGLAELTKGTKVTVNAVLPGPTWTEGVDAYLRSRLPLENAQRKAEGKAPLTFDDLAASYCRETEPTSLIARFITPEEVAHTTLFLCTASAAAINGHAQRVEGGIIRHI